MKLLAAAIVLLLPLATLAAQNDNAENSANSNAAKTVTVQQTQTATTTVTSTVSAQKSKTANPGIGDTISVERRSIVANAVQALIQSSYQIKNEGLGSQIRTIAQTQTQNMDKINESIEKGEARSSIAKFIIGPNYSEMKEARKLLQQNEVQVQQLEQLLSQAKNESEYQNLQTQIQILQAEDTALQERIIELGKGFSLFGWFNKIITGYSE